jgi:hypothetical protein
MTRAFGAPWGRELIVMSVIGTLILVTPTVLQASRGFWLIPTMMLTILTIIVLHCVRGYEVDAGELRIRRLLWDTPWPLDPTATASVRPNAMRGSWRTWGNGGIYAITGRFSGSGLGRYHAFVTDPGRTVVVTTRQGIVVVSPDRPDAFVSAIAEAANRG